MALTFSDTASIKPLSSHTYETVLKDSWSIGSVPNGGYISSLFLLIARQHMSRTHPSLHQPNPITLHLEFLRRTSADPATFTVRDLKLGSRITNLHLTLSQPHGPKNTHRNEVEGYINMSNLSAESGLTLRNSFTLPPPAPPAANLPALLTDSKDENWTLRPPISFPKFRKAAQHIRVYLPRPDRRPRMKGKSYLEQWVRFTPEGKEGGGRWTNDCLGFVVDMFPQIVEEYLDVADKDAKGGKEGEGKEPVDEAARGEERTKARFWYPTLVLNLDIKKALPEDEGGERGVEWLFVRVGAKVVRNGRMDLDILVLDEGGEVVATSTHVGLIMGTERNMAGREGKGKRGGKGGESKL